MDQRVAETVRELSVRTGEDGRVSSRPQPSRAPNPALEPSQASSRISAERAGVLHGCHPESRRAPGNCAAAKGEETQLLEIQILSGDQAEPWSGWDLSICLASIARGQR